jgi:hypothetical protein
VKDKVLIFLNTLVIHLAVQLAFMFGILNNFKDIEKLNDTAKITLIVFVSLYFSFVRVSRENNVK